MKRKIVTLLFALCLSTSVVACGSSNTETQDNVSQQNEQEDTDSSQDEKQETENPASTDESSEPADDGIINFDGEGYNVTYVKHEVSEDYEGNPCLLLYYNFTNSSEENASAAVKSYFKVFQNGVQCDSAITMDRNDSMDNYMSELQPGTTVEVCQAFEIKDMTDVTVEASDLMSFSGEKDTQILTLE